jgi:two-component system OmpR family sensor kinase
VVVAACAALALIVADAAGLLLIHRYLHDRIDEQLRDMSRPLARDLWRSGAPAGSPAPRRPAPSLGTDRMIYVFQRDGTWDAQRSSERHAEHPALPSFDELLEHAGHAQPFTVHDASDPAGWRLYAVAVGDTGGVAVVGASLAEVDRTVNRLLLIDLAVVLIVLALLGLTAALVVRLGLRPLTAMERLAVEISAGNLSKRVADSNEHTEAGRLGLALNHMLGRIEREVSARASSEQRLRQFLADASHELRTPLTSICGFAELYRRGGAPPGPRLDETMSRIEAEARRMGVLVEDLLLLARLDQQRPPALRPVDLLAVAADTIRDAHARVPDRAVRLEGLRDDSETFDAVTVLGDEHGLRQVATNLVANALHHTPPDAGVTVRIGRLDTAPATTPTVRSREVTARPGDPLAVLEVCDDGPGVAPEHAPRVFERLYRADAGPARTRGAGLGLSIVAAVVHSHGGWVELDTALGRGATFRVLLPALDVAWD